MLWWWILSSNLLERCFQLPSTLVREEVYSADLTIFLLNRMTDCHPKLAWRKGLDLNQWPPSVSLRFTPSMGASLGENPVCPYVRSLQRLRNYCTLLLELLYLHQMVLYRLSYPHILNCKLARLEGFEPPREADNLSSDSLVSTINGCHPFQV